MSTRSWKTKKIKFYGMKFHDNGDPDFCINPHEKKTFDKPSFSAFAFLDCLNNLVLKHNFLNHNFTAEKMTYNCIIWISFPWPQGLSHGVAWLIIQKKYKNWITRPIWKI